MQHGIHVFIDLYYIHILYTMITKIVRFSKIYIMLLRKMLRKTATEAFSHYKASF